MLRANVGLVGGSELRIKPRIFAAKKNFEPGIHLASFYIEAATPRRILKSKLIAQKSYVSKYLVSLISFSSLFYND